MSLSFWGLAARSFRLKVQLAPRGWALFGTTRFQSSVLLNSREAAVPRSTVTKLWQLLHTCVTSLKKGNHPSGRVLFGGAVAFLWERERISNDDAISCLKEYDNRVKSQLHILLQESTAPGVPAAPTSSDVSSTQEHLSQFQHQLQNLLQRNTEKHLSQLPLVGLRKTGRLSNASAKTHKVLHRATLQAVSRLKEAKVHICELLDDDESCEYNDFEELSDPLSGRAVLDGLEVCEETDVVAEEVGHHTTTLNHYVEHSKRHVAALPLVGLQNPGQVYNLSRNIAEFFTTRFEGDSNIHSQALFLTHLGLSLWDVPSYSSLPQALAELQDNSAAMVTDGIAALSVREAFDSAVQQAKTLLSTCTSPRLLVDVFQSSTGWQLQDSVHQGPEDHPEVIAAQGQVCDRDEDRFFEDGTTSAQNPQIGSDDYLKQSGWERFAEAQDCTVYRKQHPSGLFMYKVIGRYTDISIRDFVDVQVDHTCRKHWDTYVEKLETVDVDHETGCEVVHWIMKFPFLMSSREYVYVRRMWVNQKVAVLINRSVTHPSVPYRKQYVRVLDYISQTVMQPQTTSDEDGFEYEVTYFDNPQTSLPSSCVNWVATAAMPEFLSKVHSAALQKKKVFSGQSSIADL